MPLSELVLMTMGLLTIAMVAAGVCRHIPVPYTVFLVILGMVLGTLARELPQLHPLLEFELTPALVLFLFLPALIFESALNLDARQLVRDLAPVLALAVPALLISTAIIGAGLWLVLKLPFMLALLFGALISATDPVAVIALFKELGAPHRLTVLVEGESLLNDATAIVVFNIILGLLASGTLAMADLGIAVEEFIRVFLGGVLAGAVMGFVLSELLYRIRAGLSSYLVMSIVLAYAGFALAEHMLHVSGVMAVLSGAITMGIFGVSRIPQAATETVQEAWEMFALVCNSLLFLLVGLSVDAGQLFSRVGTILVAVLIVLIARAATVYTLVPATVRAFGLPYVKVSERHIMWWGGLKGGLAIAIAQSIPLAIPGRELIQDLTLGVVIFSLLVNAPTIRPMIGKLGIDRLTDDEEAELKHGLLGAQARAMSIVARGQQVGVLSRLASRRLHSLVAQVLGGSGQDLGMGQDIRHLYLSALRIELEELKQLYDIGVISQYIYLDIRNNLQRDREKWLADPHKREAAISEDAAPGIFLRLENAVVRRLREHDWAARLLARYQYLRFSQSLQRDIAGVLISSTVLDKLSDFTAYDQEQLAKAAQIYRDRIMRRKERLGRMAAEFPDFFKRFELHMFSNAALASATRFVEEAHKHSQVGAKAYAEIERRIKRALGELPSITIPAPEVKAHDLIGAVPLLTGLSTDLLAHLVELAKPVNYLGGDIIIGEGDHGDALYIISHGIVTVCRGDNPPELIAELREGDFFGEMALLGDHVRTATVKAKIPSRLLRLRRRDILALAKTDPELERRLSEADAARRHQASDAVSVKG